MRVVAVVALSAAGGCQHFPRQASEWSEPGVAGRGQPAQRLSDSGVLALGNNVDIAYEQSPDGLALYERFEFARRDYLLSRRVRGPILASWQWPEEAKPRERRVRFYRWQQ